MKTTLSTPVVDDRMSALADGELQGDEFAQTLAACERDPALLASWDDYHLIGDVLRSPDLLATRNASPFLTRLQSRLALEAIAPVAQTDALPPALPPTLTSLSAVTQTAANDSVFRWKMLAGVASMAALAVMIWTMAVPTSSTGSQLAQNPASTDAVLVASPQGVIVRDARLDEFLAAHKQVGGSSALQMPSGFLRNATFETSPHAGR
jgi:sigma-E factor negative regulatory protein RseA